MNLADITAGRELDGLIAEKLMGWFRVEDHRINGISFGPALWHSDLGDPMNPSPGGFGVPFYSTDISAAWEVVEKLRQENFFLRITPTEEGYRVTARSDEGLPLAIDKKTGDYDWNSKYSEAYADAPTAPLAICRAALRAVEHK
jgi:hypothetical protein